MWPFKKKKTYFVKYQEISHIAPACTCFVCIEAKGLADVQKQIDERTRPWDNRILKIEEIYE